MTTTPTPPTATMSSPQHSTARPAGREHIPLYPRGWIAIRITQLVLSLLVMAMSAYNVYYVAYDGNSFMLAVAVMCLVSSTYLVVAHISLPKIYNYWAVLGLDIFFVIMWLCSFALQAARVAPMYEVVNGASSYTYNYRTGKYSKVSLTNTENAWLGTQAGSAALGGVQLYVLLSLFYPMPSTHTPWNRRN
ncbi:hypothetical protein VTI74DRAFT_10282 [Chaetomium olivicolor]